MRSELSWEVRVKLNELTRFLLLSLVISLLASCGRGDGLSFKNVNQTKGPGVMRADYDLFDGPVQSPFQLRGDQQLSVKYALDIQAGKLTLTVRGPFPSIAPLYRKTFTASASGEIQQALRRKGRYVIEIRGEAATGSYDLHWEILEGP